MVQKKKKFGVLLPLAVIVIVSIITFIWGFDFLNSPSKADSSAVLSMSDTLSPAIPAPVDSQFAATPTTRIDSSLIKNYRLELSVYPDDSKIYINSAFQGLSPLAPVSLDSGSYVVSVAKENYISARIVIDVPEDIGTPVEFVLSRLQSKVCSLTVTTYPSAAQVFIDGYYRGLSPITLVDLKCGIFDIKISKEYYHSDSLTVNLSGNESFKTHFTMVPFPVDLYNLSIISDPDTVTVLINGKKTGKTPLTVKLKEGQYKIIGQRSGYSLDTKYIDIPREEVTPVYLELAGVGNISVTTDPPGAIIQLNGKGFYYSPRFFENVPEGRNEIRVKFKSREESHWIYLSPGQHKSVHVDEQWLAGDSLFIPGLNIFLTYIPQGSFVMGSPDTEKGRKTYEEYQRTKSINHFLISMTEVTQRQWQIIMQSLPDIREELRGDNLPVVNVSWNDVQLFLKKLEQHPRTSEIFELYPGSEFRLPHEEEWEYACRAGSITAFSTGPNLVPEFANYDCSESHGKESYIGKAMPVGIFLPNGWGLHDMHGNVMEWCQNYYRYSGLASREASLIKPRIHTKINGMVRGGSWSATQKNCRSAARRLMDLDTRNEEIGFRIVLEL